MLGKVSTLKSDVMMTWEISRCPAVTVFLMSQLHLQLPLIKGASFSNATLTSGTHSVGTTLTAAVDFDDPNGVAGATLTYTW
jgi:hypothetical protein